MKKIWKYLRENISGPRLGVIRNSCGDPYLIRWTLFDLFGYSMKVHSIVRSDDDRALHDHPWDFATLMLAGGYWEHRFAKGEDMKRLDEGDLKSTEFIYAADDDCYHLKEWIKPGRLRMCRAPYPHRLELREEVSSPDYFPEAVRPMFAPAITLVFMWPKKREWGFYTPGKWLHFLEFLKTYGRQDC